jgi:uroporphyrin-III C-methyltransferase
LQNIQTNLNQYLKASNVLTLATLKETKYLIAQADLQLKLYQNKSIAIDLLTTAEKTASTIPNFDATTINQAITNDISAINNFNYIDIATLLAKIHSLSMQIDALPLVNTKLDEHSETAPKKIMASESTQSSAWVKFWNNTLEQLQTIIIIRKQDVPLQPILSQTQQLFTRQDIELTLQQASWAVISHQDQVYQTSLKKVTDLLVTYFSYNLDATKELAEKIKDLQSTNIALQSPPLSSLPVITAKIEQEQVIDENK